MLFVHYRKLLYNDVVTETNENHVNIVVSVCAGVDDTRTYY